MSAVPTNNKNMNTNGVYDNACNLGLQKMNWDNKSGGAPLDASEIVTNY